MQIIGKYNDNLIRILTNKLLSRHSQYLGTIGFDEGCDVFWDRGQQHPLSQRRASQHKAIQRPNARPQLAGARVDSDIALRTGPTITRLFPIVIAHRSAVSNQLQHTAALFSLLCRFCCILPARAWNVNRRTLGHGNIGVAGAQSDFSSAVGIAEITPACIKHPTAGST